MSSDFLEAELLEAKSEIQKLEGCTIVTCVAAQVRVGYKKTDHKNVNIIIQFTAGYPNEAVVVELTSKTLSEKLLAGLIKMCDEEAKKLLGQKQVLHIIKFVRNFVIENPLCVCSDEIATIKRDLLSQEDRLKLRQDMAQVLIRVRQEQYLMNLTVTVPELYPLEQVRIVADTLIYGTPLANRVDPDETAPTGAVSSGSTLFANTSNHVTMRMEVADCNFPDLLKNFFLGQAVELARKCVQPPTKPNKKEPPFKPKPSLLKVCQFLVVECVKRYPMEQCPICKERVLLRDPEAVTKDPKMRVERVYCGHLFHHGCLGKYMRTPPFKDGKFCPDCGKRIFHDKWKVSPELAEARWAHKQARMRELDEVSDFLK